MYFVIDNHIECAECEYSLELLTDTSGTLYYDRDTYVSTDCFLTIGNTLKYSDKRKMKGTDLLLLLYFGYKIDGVFPNGYDSLIISCSRRTYPESILKYKMFGKYSDAIGTNINNYITFFIDDNMADDNDIFIPEGIEVIQHKDFEDGVVTSNCLSTFNAYKVSIPNSVIRIEDDTFYNFPYLNEVEIPKRCSMGYGNFDETSKSYK